jgi:hypothetical protein
MKQRREALRESRPVEEFRKLEAYPTKNTSSKSHIDDFMAVLNSIQLDQPTISFQELIQGNRGEQIAKIFELKKNKKGKYQFGNLKKLYQQSNIGMFLSDKGTELHTYSGIWYDMEGH